MIITSQPNIRQENPSEILAWIASDETLNYPGINNQSEINTNLKDMMS